MKKTISILLFFALIIAGYAGILANKDEINELKNDVVVIKNSVNLERFDEPIFGAATAVRIGNQVTWTSDLTPSSSDSVNLGSLSKKVLGIYGTNLNVTSSTLGTVNSASGNISLWSNDSGYATLASTSESITGVTYNNSTGAWTMDATYAIPTSTSFGLWNTAYGWGNHASAGYQAGNAKLTSISAVASTTGNLLVGNNTTGFSAMTVGTDNYVLTASSTAANGLAWMSSTSGSGSMNTVKEGGSQVGDADMVSIDFGTGFDVAESPDTESNITFDFNEFTTDTTLLGGDMIPYWEDSAGDEKKISYDNLKAQLDDLTMNGLIQSTASGISYFSGLSLGVGTTTPTASTTLQGVSGGTIFNILSSAGIKLLEAFNDSLTVVLGGKWDFGDAVVEIPNGASPTVDAAGEIAIDTTSGQAKWFDGSATHVVNGFWSASIQLASTTLQGIGAYGAAGTSSIQTAWEPSAMTIVELGCETGTAGTEVSMTCKDDSGDVMKTLRCDYDSATSTVTTNNTLIAYDRMICDFGTASGTPNNIYMFEKGRLTED